MAQLTSLQDSLSIRELSRVLCEVCEHDGAQFSSDRGEGALCSIKFHTTSVELILNWLDRLTFSDGDIYSWKKVTDRPPISWTFLLSRHHLCSAAAVCSHESSRGPSTGSTSAS